MNEREVDCKWFVTIFVLVVAAALPLECYPHNARNCNGLDTFRWEFRTTELFRLFVGWTWWNQSLVTLPSNIIAQYTERLLRLPKPQAADGSDNPKVPKGHLMWLRPCETPIFYLQEWYPLRTPKINMGKVQLQHVNKCKNICENVACAILGLCLKEALTRDLHLIQTWILMGNHVENRLTHIFSWV